jgi:hypothetical protein
MKATFRAEIKQNLKTITDVEKAMQQAFRRAGDIAGRAMVKAAVEYVKGKKRLKVGDIRSGITLLRPGLKAEKLVWKLKVESKRAVPLAKYPHRQTKTGVTVRVNVGKSAKLRSAFVATLKGGHTGIFRRVGKARLPIKEMFSSKLTDVINDSGVGQRLQENAQARMAAELQRIVPLELAKLEGKKQRG